MQINGLRAMIVGGASGMARATAERIANGGGKVAILDRAGSAGADVAKELGGAYFETNILDFEGTEGVIADAVAWLGGLDAVVTTAGGGTGKRTLTKDGPHPLDEFRAVVDLNLTATFNINRLAAWHMSKNEPNEDEERGVIINTASIAAFDGQIGQAAYGASMGGIVGMTLPVARDLAVSGIRVNTIAPGLVDTPIYDTAPDPAAFKATLGKSALFPARLGTPAEFAELALSLITNRYMNAAVVRMDAGTRLPAR